MAYMKPISEIKAKFGLETNGATRKFFTNACYRYMEPYVPKLEGVLRDTVKIEEESVTYESTYARYQYKGQAEDGTRKVVRYTTPGTSPYWDKKMWAIDKNSVIEETQKYMEGK